MRMTLEEISAAVGGTLHGAGGVVAEGASIDTRTMRRGDVFFAVPGQVRDGHEFVPAAAAAGASAVVVARAPLPAAAVPWIEVGDTVGALQALGARSRRSARARVVGLTGSCGKTTTKEMLAAALAGSAPVLSTRGNLNNHLGVPLVLSDLGPEHGFAVIEMGANHFGEIDLLARIVDPDAGLVTCVAAAHTEFFEDLEGVARAKGELFAAMRPDAVAVVNVDDPRVRAMARAPRRAVTYGSVRALGPDVLLEQFRPSGRGQQIAVDAGGRKIRARVAIGGAHNALNATAALAVVAALGEDLDLAAEGIAGVRPAPGRGAFRTGRRLEVLDDTYNANPRAMGASLSLLASAGAGRRLVAVLGDMLELGREAGRYHAEVGEAAARSHVDLLVAVGEHAGRVRDGAAGAGLPAGAIECFAKAEDVLAPGVLDALMREGDLVLVKGSRGMKMEGIVESLLEW